jgi:diguanylate cyclase (GGDEF)-like protein/PAS domain S-box-containing protein
VNRRTDHQLRQSISNLEKLLLSTETADTILCRCLRELGQLLKAGFGYVFEVQPMEGGTVRWDLAGFGRLNTGFQPEAAISTSRTIPQSLLFQFRSGRFITSNNGLPDGHPLPGSDHVVSNMLCIPLADVRNLYGVVYLCNLPENPEHLLTDRLRPFVTAACCLLRMSWSKTLTHETAELSVIKASEVSMEKLFNSLFDGVVIVDREGEVVRCNRAASEIFQVPRDQVAGLPISQFFDYSVVGLVNGTGRLTGSADANGSLSIIRGVTVRPARGAKKLADLRVFSCGMWGSDCRGVVIDDISEQMRSASEFRETQQRLRALTTLAPVGILQLNRAWECTYVNDTWCDFVGMTQDEITGVGWVNAVHHLDCDRFLDSVRKEAAGHGRYTGDIRFQTPLGDVRWASISACMLYDETGAVDGLLMTLSDITEYLRKEQRLREIAEHDQLTGLANRNSFHTRLTSALEESERYGPVALMFIDLDNFKHINDTLGHDAGDDLLIQVAQRLRDQIRKVDTISRVGGDEFTVILTHLSNQTAVKLVAEKLLKALAEPFVLGERNVYVTCSIGIAVVEGMTDRKKFLKQADIALYKAKESGRNQYRFYTSELNRDAHLMMSLRQSVKASVEEDFSIVFQPWVDAANGQVIGIEAFTRWNTDAGNNVSPTVFIKQIEESGLIVEFSRWLFDQVFRQSQQWRKQMESGLKISINLSERQFLCDELTNEITHLVHKYGLSPSWFVLEVKEKALLADPEKATTALNSLHREGFSIHLDDFGTGYSALMHLQNMPINCIKIDHSCVADLMSVDSKQRVLNAVLSLADSLELGVIAEGVEDKDTSDWLLNHGCALQQGFLFSAAVLPADISEIFGSVTAN